MNPSNLVPKQIADKNGKLTTVWVNPDQDMSGFNTPASVSAPPKLSSAPATTSADHQDEESEEDIVNDLHEHLSATDSRWKINNNSGELEYGMGVRGTVMEGLESVDGVDLTTKVRVGVSSNDGERSYYVASDGFDGPMEEPLQAEALNIESSEDWNQEGWEWDSRNSRYQTQNKEAAFAAPGRAVAFSGRANKESYEDFRDEIPDDY